MLNGDVYMQEDTYQSGIKLALLDAGLLKTAAGTFDLGGLGRLTGATKPLGHMPTALRQMMQESKPPTLLSRAHEGLKDLWHGSGAPGTYKITPEELALGVTQTAVPSGMTNKQRLRKALPGLGVGLAGGMGAAALASKKE
jgi:hypothetical protein